jgi:anti-sigma factor RsiW
MSDERIHEYLDAALPPDEMARFERELASDAGLSDRLRELRELDAALGMLPGHVAPADFTARVARASRRPRASVLLRLVVPLAAAAGVAVAVLLARPSDAPASRTEAAYIWERDVETYGSLALTDLEDEILEEIEGT